MKLVCLLLNAKKQNVFVKDYFCSFLSAQRKTERERERMKQKEIERNKEREKEIEIE